MACESVAHLTFGLMLDSEPIRARGIIVKYAKIHLINSFRNRMIELDDSDRSTDSKVVGNIDVTLVYPILKIGVNNS